MTKLPLTHLKERTEEVVGKFSLKTHIYYIFLETSHIDLDICDVYNNISTILSEILTVKVATIP